MNQNNNSNFNKNNVNNDTTSSTSYKNNVNQGSTSEGSVSFEFDNMIVDLEGSIEMKNDSSNVKNPESGVMDDFKDNDLHPSNENSNNDEKLNDGSEFISEDDKEHLPSEQDDFKDVFNNSTSNKNTDNTNKKDGTKEKKDTPNQDKENAPMVGNNEALENTPKKNEANPNEEPSEQKESLGNDNKNNDLQNKKEGSEPSENKPNEKANSAADNKRSQVKQRDENNRRRNSNNGKKDSNLKDRIKNGSKNRTQNLVNKAKDKASNSNIAQSINQQKQKLANVKKKIQNTKKNIKMTKTVISAIIGVLGTVGFILLLIVVIGILITSLVSIFSFDFFNSESKNNSADAKTKEKLETLYSNYSNVSSELGTMSVLYPYYPEMWGSDVLKCIPGAANALDTEGEDEYEDGEEPTDVDDTEDINSDNLAEDNEYLKFYQKSSHRYSLKLALKKLSNNSEDDFYTYLFDKKRFKYKKYIFDRSNCDESELKESIKKDLKKLKNNFSTTSFASLNKDADRNKIVTFADIYVGDPASSVGKIPYYEGGLANNAQYDGNDFNTDVSPDSAGRSKKGLGPAGFVNWVYWSVIGENFGNTDSIDTILNNAQEIDVANLKQGDIGTDDNKTIIAIYNNGFWIYEDAANGYVISDTGGGKFTKFYRLNYFKDELYEFTIRTNKPTPSEWNSNSIPIFNWPSSDNLIGECVFYAKNRALEIIQELYNNGSLNEVQYKNYSDRIKNNLGNGDDFWHARIDGNPGTIWNAFSDNSRSANIQDIHPGAFIGVTSVSSQGNTLGHVMIVEYANPDEDKIVLSDGSNGTRTDCTKTNFDCMSCRFLTYTYQEFYNTYSINSSTGFRGYLFFLRDN